MNPKFNRFKIALQCQDACNFTGLVNTALVPTLKQILDEGGDSKAVVTDPAVILIMDKLRDLMGYPDALDFWGECTRRSLDG